MNALKPKRVMAISSGGGHWIQLTRLRKAFEGHQVTWVTVMSDTQAQAFNIDGRHMTIPDATRWNKFKLIWLFIKILYCTIRIRPHVIITTGAAPGYFALVIGRVFGIKTCWIDSVANVEKMSLSGSQSRRWADLWLTQWEHLQKIDGPKYRGNVLPELLPDLEETSERPGGDWDQPHEVSSPKPRKRVLAISSGGGHWVELLRIRGALEGHEIHWATVRKEYHSDVEETECSFHVIHDATRWNKLKLVLLFARIVLLVRKVRPEVILTTGAAPGYFAVMAGRVLGCRTCWIDSLVNVDTLSLSGEKAGKWSDLWLTQWNHLERENGPSYKGGLFPELLADSEVDSEHVSTEEATAP